MLIELVKKNATKTSRGILSKAWYKIDGKLCLVKGNSVDVNGVIGHEPYSEVMASKIAEVLHFSNLTYSLMDAKLFPDVKVHGLKHVSVCEYYIPKDFKVVSFYNYIIAKLGSEPADYFEAYKKILPVKPLFYMLFFDALIGNEDRHLSNFDILLGLDGTESLAPLYDHGASLLAWHGRKELGLAGKEGRFDLAKPFRTTHNVQIKLITEPLLSKTDLTILYRKLIESIEPVFDFLPDYRIGAIKNYLRWRMKYIEKVMM